MRPPWLGDALRASKRSTIAITEMIFSYPGLGMAVLTAIQGNDYPLIQGCTLLVTLSVLVANFTVDIMISFLDPRVRASLVGGK